MDEPKTYQVQYTEPAEIEIEAEHSRLAELISEKHADRWQDGLIAEIDRLALFPASRQIARENTHYDVEVRRLLYHGPARRRGGTAYRILFYVVEATDDEAGNCYHSTCLAWGARAVAVVKTRSA